MSGPIPVSFSEIDAWSRLTGIDIPGYEAVQLRQLSRDYCNQYHASKNPNEPQPGLSEENRRKYVEQSFANLIEQHKAKK